MNNPKQNRGRHRNNARRSNPSRQNFDSNGPGVRIRGNATQVYEKYIHLARDAQGSGDRVMAENMLQHAEHYYRILNDGASDHGNTNRSSHNDARPEADVQNENADAANANSDDGRNDDPQGDDAEPQTTAGTPTSVSSKISVTRPRSPVTTRPRLRP